MIVVFPLVESRGGGEGGGLLVGHIDTQSASCFVRTGIVVVGSKLGVFDRLFVSSRYPLCA